MSSLSSTLRYDSFGSGRSLPARNSINGVHLFYTGL